MIYLDNAATSWPKPQSVISEMNRCLLDYCANPGRSGHKMALKSQEVIYNCRECVSDFFGLDNPLGVIFTSNATAALNIVIKGLLDKDSHAVITSMEHNSVMRPLVATGAMYDVLCADKFGYVDSNDLENLIQDNTSLIICTLSSNVCGSIQPFEKIAEISHRHNIPFLLDASQGAGTVDIDMKRMNIDYLAAPGHKGLLGPQGTGILCINSLSCIATLMEGGTGSESKLLVQPDYLPDRFESGTVNVPGISGLLRGIEYINCMSKEKILNHELNLCKALADNLSDIKSIKLIGYNPMKPRSAVLSFVMEDEDCLILSSKLSIDYNIALRAGYHCAYTAHSVLGTENTGTVRVSFGPFNTEDDVNALTKAIKEIALQNH